MGASSPSLKLAPATHEQTAPFWVRAALVLGLAVLLFFLRLGARTLWSSEFRWAQVVREMKLNANYFWPTIDGRVYYDKPLGSYWLVLGAARLFGSLDERAVRLPSAVAGVLGVALLMLLVRRLYGGCEAALCGFILATSFSYVFFSRHASADVETVTGELAALWLFVRNQERRDGWWVIALWLVMAATSLTKGLLGFVLPLLVIGVYSCVAEGIGEFYRGVLRGPFPGRARWLMARNRWLFNRKTPVGAALALTLYFAPFIVSGARSGSNQGLAMVYHENLVRFFHPFDHRAPVYLYIYVIFALMAPWSALLPGALAEVHHSRPAATGSAKADRFALVYFWATFVFFTFSGSRRSYYLLPILPAGAMLVGRTLARDLAELWPLARTLLVGGYFVVATAVVVSIAAVLPPAHLLPGGLGTLPPAPDRLIFGVFWLVEGAAVLYAASALTTRRIFLATGITAYLFMAYLFVFAMPAAETWRGERTFALEVRRAVGPDTDALGLYRTLGPSFFYLDPPKPLPYFQNQPVLEGAVKSGAIRWVIVRRHYLDELKLPATVVAEEATFPFEDQRQRDDKELLLKIEPHPRTDAARP